jgi:hypothetical protein
MDTHLPSMTSLRVYKAAARHFSFAQRDIDPCTATMATGHVLGNFEVLVGTKLLIRDRTLSCGLMCRAAVSSPSASYSEISVATDQVADSNDELTVQCLGTFAMKHCVAILDLLQAPIARGRRD